MYPVRRQISPHAARLRRERTDAEDRFWQAMRNRHIDGYKFRFQHSLWPYVADFACLEAKLIVEIDGGQHNEEADRKRTADLEARGFKVIRFWNTDVLTNLDGVITAVRAALADCMASKKKTLPTPPAKAGGADDVVRNQASALLRHDRTKIDPFSDT